MEMKENHEDTKFINLTPMQIGDVLELIQKELKRQKENPLPGYQKTLDELYTTIEAGYSN